MAKRTLGLGKAAKARKKQKPEESTTPDNTEDAASAASKSQSNELTVELDEEVDPEDDLAQLRGLWSTYIKSARDNELVLNGIIHESDRLLRNQTDDNKLPAEFHAVYGLALAELALFHTEDDGAEEAKDPENNVPAVHDYFEAALERIGLGQEQYPESVALNFAKAHVLINRIPLEYISQLDIDTKKSKQHPDISTILDDALECYTKGMDSVVLFKNFALLDVNVFETLKSLDDLLEIIRNFGKDGIDEGLDSDNEDDDEDNKLQLHKSHPLYGVYDNDKYFKWLIKNGESFGNYVVENSQALFSKDSDSLTPKEKKDLVYAREVSLKIGQLLLQAAEKPSSIFTSITYDSDIEDDVEIEGYTAKDAQKEAIEYTTKAVKFFERAEDEEDVQSWVNYAEAMISLGNLYDYESKEQEDAYKVAEKRLKRANNAANGKYQKILDNLLEG